MKTDGNSCAAMFSENRHCAAYSDNAASHKCVIGDSKKKEKTEENGCQGSVMFSTSTCSCIKMRADSRKRSGFSVVR